MQFVEGETLADRIARGPLPLPQALALARQIALGLEAAHAQRRRASRPEAREHPGGARRPGQAARLRPGPDPGRRAAQLRSTRRRRPQHGAERRGRRRHRALHEPRAGAGRARRPPDRRLVVRLRALRDAERTARLRRPQPARRHGRAGRRREPDWKRLPAGDARARARRAAPLPAQGRTERLRDVGDARRAARGQRVPTSLEARPRVTRRDGSRRAFPWAIAAPRRSSPRGSPWCARAGRPSGRGPRCASAR